MPDLREMPLSALDILTALMPYAIVDLRLGSAMGNYWAKLDIYPRTVGSWIRIADVERADDIADVLLQVASQAEAWAIGEGWREQEEFHA